ncbi:MAG: ribosomal protein S18-alanine N-acetyltransferase [Negativicutes bacterium]|nr:ribosomal protein S18-alanine N-acetyltransferase [Negativicutes bacterium]
MKTGIRSMDVNDIDPVVTVEQQSFAIPWSRAAFETELAENTLAHYLVAEVDGAVVGYCGMWIILDEAHLTNVAVLPEYRSQGIGRSLLITLMEYAKLRGATCMTLEVRKSNYSAQRLYRRLGFMPRGLRRQYYTDTAEDAVIMWRDDLCSEPGPEE